MEKRGDIVKSIKNYVSAANYLSAIQIYLRSNYLLKYSLEPEHLKPRLLGHWGTCPGINFVYANLNYLIKKHSCSMMFVLGPGHGFPALQANLFMEGTLGKYYPKAKTDLNGVEYIASQFSWPYGFPSHSNPGAPGVILEGGELGYALSTSYGAILDNPELIVACLIGDGEAETGPTATAWHLNKFIDPAKNGAVLPILHVNGYKISGPTIFGRMSNQELYYLFYGYGYDPIIVEGKDVYTKMITALERSYKKIRIVQKKARTNKKLVHPRMPMIILKTPKGWTGIKEINGRKVEGNFLSHQVVGKHAGENPDELRLIENWMKSYSFNSLFHPTKGFSDSIKKIIPKPKLRMGDNKHAFADKNLVDLRLPPIKKFCQKVDVPGKHHLSSMLKAGDYLAEVFNLNKNNFRLFSPDETYSNKLQAVFEETDRAFVWPIKEWDEDLSRDGRVIEMLSEHSLQGMAQGYVLTGRHMMFASYEAFIEIVSSMADQYEKFLRGAEEVSWRGNFPSFNYILTSSGWRQEHNGFSHQNPSFISGMLDKSGCKSRLYFPAGVNSMLAVLEKCLKSRNEINVIVVGKTFEPIWITPEEAKKELIRGLMIWDFASDKNPDIVFSAIGEYLTKESLAAIKYLKERLKIKIRFVNIIELTALGVGNQDCTAPFNDFEDYFTKDKPVIFNYHGYPTDLNSLLIKHWNSKRFSVNGYLEQGSTTTPFDMQVRNGTSRYHLVMEAAKTLFERKVISKKDCENVVKEFETKLKDHKKFIQKEGVDPLEISEWRWEE